MKKLDEKTIEREIVTPAVPEKTEKVPTTLDELVAESENFAKGIANNQASKVTADEMIAILTAKKALVDAEIVEAKALGVKTLEELEEEK